MSKYINNIYVRGALIVILSSIVVSDIGSFNWYVFVVVMNLLVNIKYNRG